MTFETTFSKPNEPEKSVYGAFLGFFIATFTICTVLKPFFGPLPVSFNADKLKPIVYNFSNSETDVYEIEGDIRIHGNKSTIFIASSHKDQIKAHNWIINPYARKMHPAAMAKVRKYKIKYETSKKIPHCDKNFNAPAIIFSAGGYAGNYFHAFVDVLIPLFFTSQQFSTRVVFLITNYQSTWISKYNVILKTLTKYDIYNMDIGNDEILCFSKVIVGLKKEKLHYSMMRNFTQFLRTTFSLENHKVSPVDVRAGSRRPRMLIISRRQNRHLLNEAEIIETGRKLGFDVVAKRLMWNVSLTAKFVNSFDVMVGVHGAGLTNMVFLPENGVVVQIVPLELDKIAKYCFENSAKSMKLRYIEYKIDLNESSLVQKYSLDPKVVIDKGFNNFKSIYLDNQDVNLDLGRFRKTMVKVLELLHT